MSTRRRRPTRCRSRTEHPLEPFGVYGDELAAVGAEPPFPRAFENDTFTMDLDTARSLLEDAHFSSVDASVVTLQVSWPDAATAAAGVMGTPFDRWFKRCLQRNRFDDALEKRFVPDEPSAVVGRQTAALIARATAA